MLQWLKNIGGAVLGKVAHVGQVAAEHPELVQAVASLVKGKGNDSTAQDLMAIGAGVLKQHGWDGAIETLPAAINDLKAKVL
jgi:uncharacterized protein (DUF362 family)